MFKIPVGDLLASYTGDSKSFSFSGEVYDGFFDDISFLKPLEFSIEIRAMDDGVSVHFESLDTEIEYEGIPHDIHIEKIDREFRNFIDPLDPDDIRGIDHGMIDLVPIIREELIMATHTL